MTDDEKEPTIVTKKAIDVLPKLHGIWCSIADGKPFVNTIELRDWSESGDKITFMLSSFNFYFARPDEYMNVVELEPSKYDSIDKIHADDEKFRKKQPISDAEYSRMWAA